METPIPMFHMCLMEPPRQPMDYQLPMELTVLSMKIPPITFPAHSIVKLEELSRLEDFGMDQELTHSEE